MATPTSLESVYDAFFIKSSVDYTGKEDQVYQFFLAARSKCIKTIQVDLTYAVDLTTYLGSFNEDIGQDGIELIALNMLLEEKRKRKSELDYMKQHLGSKDFNRLPDKVSEYKVLQESIKELQDEIFSFRQEFYSYEN